MSYSRIKYKQEGGVEDILFWLPSPEILRFVTAHLQIPRQKSFHPLKFSKIGWHSLEIPRSKSRVFLEHHWKFHFFFNWPLEFPVFVFSIILEILCPQLLPLVWIFSGIAQWVWMSPLKTAMMPHDRLTKHNLLWEIGVGAERYVKYWKSRN